MSYRKRPKNLYKGTNFIASNLRILRILNGLTQEDVANELKCSRSAYSKLESELKFATFPVLYKLSIFYDVDLDYIIYFNITAHLLSLIKRTSISIDPLDFVESYSKLSEAAKGDINKRMQSILEHEKKFNVF
ncbi:MAG: helix-turn-helix transcriptional regulator [Anaerofustis stercorihominis]|nr:helix-turn-helix transcriptional regulator [Anaerofustis stercorihominis]